MLIGPGEFEKWKMQIEWVREGERKRKLCAMGHTLYEVPPMYSITSSNLQNTPVEAGV